MGNLKRSTGATLRRLLASGLSPDEIIGEDFVIVTRPRAGIVMRAA
ncbi:MAG: hypothetical protein ACLQU1_04145 [Bryobacteraceae bacterium]